MRDGLTLPSLSGAVQARSFPSLVGARHCGLEKLFVTGKREVGKPGTGRRETGSLGLAGTPPPTSTGWMELTMWPEGALDLPEGKRQRQVSPALLVASSPSAPHEK
jgi:hypothetical protein